MRTLKILLMLLVSSVGLAKGQFTKAELQVSGLSCALCARATEKSLKSFPFVSDIKPDLMHNIMIITFKDGATVNFDEISKAVHEAGFFVSSLKCSINFDKVKVDGNQFSYGPYTYKVMNSAEKPLNGEATVTLIDKGFAPRSVTKKYLVQATDIPPANTGKVYHVTI